MKKIILLILVLFFLAIKIGYCIEDKVVVVVNNEVITKAELDVYTNLMKLQMGEEGWVKSGMSDKKALESLIEDRLVLQEAKNKKIEIDERLIETRLQKMKSGFSSSDEFSEFLMQQGLSPTELKESIKGQLLSDRLIMIEVRSRIFISPLEVTKYYQDHLSDFYTPESAQLESIFIQDKNQAQEVYAKLKSGADFTELQKQYSKRSNFGLVKKGDLQKKIEDAVFNLEIGKFSQPIEVSGGYYLFLVSNKFPPKEKELAEVQKQISDMLLAMKFNIRLNEWLKQLRDKSYIVIKDE